MGNPLETICESSRARFAKAVRDIAYDAMETMKNGMSGMSVNAEESNAHEATLEEHLKRWHKGQRPTEPCKWMVEHGLGGEKKSNDVGATGSEGESVSSGESGKGVAENTEDKNFTGLKDGKIWKGGKELAPTFQDGGTKSKYRELRNKWVKQLLGKEDCTIDENGNPVNFEDGFQFAFQTTKSEDDGGMSDEDYDKTVDELVKITGSKPYIGNFDVPEISFHVSDKKEALKFIEKYNQHSAWDWKEGKLLINKKWKKETNSVKQ